MGPSKPSKVSVFVSFSSIKMILLPACNFDNTKIPLILRYLHPFITYKVLTFNNITYILKKVVLILGEVYLRE